MKALQVSLMTLVLLGIAAGARAEVDPAAQILEPETLLLFGAALGIIGFALMRRRRH